MGGMGCCGWHGLVWGWYGAGMGLILGWYGLVWVAWAGMGCMGWYGWHGVTNNGERESLSTTQPYSASRSIGGLTQPSGIPDR